MTPKRKDDDRTLLTRNEHNERRGPTIAPFEPHLEHSAKGRGKGGKKKGSLSEAMQKHFLPDGRIRHA